MPDGLAGVRDVSRVFGENRGGSRESASVVSLPVRGAHFTRSAPTSPERAIRSKAYSLWESRGKAHGGEKTDWYAAEAFHRLATTSRWAPSPPYFSYVQVSEMEPELDSSIISYIREVFFNNPLNYWVEMSLDIGAMFEYDCNRRLHFDEGFLSVCQRILKDDAIQSIADVDHFPYRDLPKFRAKVAAFERLYSNGAGLPSPIFFYSAPYQLEILDGVHRCLAAFEVGRLQKANGRFTSRPYRVRLGVDRLRVDPATLMHQLWSEAPGRECLEVRPAKMVIADEGGRGRRSVSGSPRGA